MCGIAGYFDKTQNDQAEVGQTILKMLKALGLRGPDSAGVAIYNHALDGDMVLRVKLGEEKTSSSFVQTEPFAEKSREITQRVQNLEAIGEYNLLFCPSDDSNIRGVPGRQLLQFAGAIHAEDLKLMRQIIEEGCEQVDLDEW